MLNVESLEECRAEDEEDRPLNITIKSKGGFNDTLVSQEELDL